jgi:hypothetical protein
LLKSEIIKEIIKPKKLVITNNNWINEKPIILLSKIPSFLKFFIEKKNIGKDTTRPKIKE